MDNTCNGWSNYITWQVWNELTNNASYKWIGLAELTHIAMWKESRKDQVNALAYSLEKWCSRIWENLEDVNWVQMANHRITNEELYNASKEKRYREMIQ